jgi:hypothetical protein
MIRLVLSFILGFALMGGVISCSEVMTANAPVSNMIGIFDFG